MDTKNFKAELSGICKVANWTPSDDQLRSIAKELKGQVLGGQKLTVANCQHAISKVCPGTQYRLVEGVDNSDLNTLLMLAMGVS